MRTAFHVHGMHCQACVGRLTKALEQVPGVRAAEVTLVPPRATIDSDSITPAPARSHPSHPSHPSLVPPLDALLRAAATAGGYGLSRIDPPSDHPNAATQPAQPAMAIASPPPSIYPLLLIIGYIAGAAALTAFIRCDHTGSAAWHAFMLDFMAGFFLVFSFFKLLDLRGFVSAYRGYDIVARPWPAWGYAYPFVELALGIAYLLRWELTLVNWITLALMLVGAIGVLRALLNKTTIRCACLGTALNLPMTTVTLIEDLGMAAMAAVMLIGL